ncbi:unnamed protein product [Callosobruchus maculatus]|uniref:DUF7869 domain-containing protein n=1 Tax=Callosobruchus maculatus TaxID=64391 RepID=A0A653CAM3_CALMS|nr:unnamed protein product [Callosobruchus maculatus]
MKSRTALMLKMSLKGKQSDNTGRYDVDTNLEKDIVPISEILDRDETRLQDCPVLSLVDHTLGHIEEGMPVGGEPTTVEQIVNKEATSPTILDQEEVSSCESSSGLEDDPFQSSGSSYHPSDAEDYHMENKNGKRKRCLIGAAKESLGCGDGIIPDNTTYIVQKNKKIRAKKGQSDPTKWRRNTAKALRKTGKEYEGKKKVGNGSKYEIVRRNSRKLGDRCNSSKCMQSTKRQCGKITEEQRQELFKKFWSEMDWNQRKTFVATLVNKGPVGQQTTKTKSRRQLSLSYHLKINDIILPVCKKMFINTLALGEWSVLSWVKNSHSSGIISQTSSFPNRKKAVNVQRRLAIKEFLERLPKLPSHYCRSSTSKMYLENVFNSYSEVYELYLKETDKELVCSKPVFMSEMKLLNIDIFQPRKDQCDLCFSFKQGNVSSDIYQQHLIEKNRAREEKSLDKEKALAGEVCAYTMDVQAVQLVPFVLAGIIYFKQKLACHNFTIYSLSDNKVVCYVWHEGEGGLDANCFASCLMDFLDTEIKEEDKQKPKIFYSDGCCAQNRNSLLSNALFHYSKTKNVEIIQKYLVKGHSQMECDSVHSTIEKAKKNRKIQSPSNYVDIIRQARKRLKQPYKVKYVDFDFFKCYDEIKYISSIRPGLKKGDPCVTDLRALRYSADGISYKLNFDHEWITLPKRVNWTVGAIKPLYDTPLPIKGDKYDHLQALKKVIDKDYHGFYDSLRKLQ